MKLSILLKEIKGVFKPPTKKYYLGKLYYGAPYFYPKKFNRNIITFKKLILTPQEELDKKDPRSIKYNKFKNKPHWSGIKSWTFKIFNNWYYLEIGSPIYITTTELGWKDKYRTPRHENDPAFYLYFFHWQFCIFWRADDSNRYYEQVLWYLFYADKDIEKAKKTWGWSDYVTKESTWSDEYLINKK